MIGPMKLIINGWKLEFGDNFLRKLPHADSRFSVVAELKYVWIHDIRGKIDTQMLSPKTRYAAYLVYRSERSYKDLVPAKGIIKFVNLDEDHDAERRATTLSLQQGLVSRPDGWMEVQLGMFYNDLGENGPVEARLLKEDARPLKRDQQNMKHLVVEGIEFRPATNAKENVKNRRNGIFSKLRISG
ncbi:F-box protein PP2-B10-like [Olea europaea var. sylvestris]|uniref:F-box protein PP2-B10-like n=1 Tax=Olea europaea var. sylvestris TaxID=158386 RepID=UPI000C1D8594|nr:F-box protein PP2-B10-like [Olea europaea var. sylvestris]